MTGPVPTYEITHEPAVGHDRRRTLLAVAVVVLLLAVVGLVVVLVLTGRPSGASKAIGSASRTKAAVASFKPLIRPCGIATPWPRPVEPSRSRANRLSNTVARAMP